MVLVEPCWAEVAAGDKDDKTAKARSVPQQKRSCEVGMLVLPSRLLEATLGNLGNCSQLPIGSSSCVKGEATAPEPLHSIVTS